MSPASEEGNTHQGRGDRESQGFSQAQLLTCRRDLCSVHPAPLTAPPPRPPRVPVCVRHRRGDPGSSPGSARGGAAAAPAAEGSDEVAALRLRGLSKWGQSSLSRSRWFGRRWERGTCKLLLGVFSPPSFGPCPRRKWSVELGDHYFFRQLRGAPTRRSPVGLSAVGAPLCVWFPPAHLGRR